MNTLPTTIQLNSQDKAGQKSARLLTVGPLPPPPTGTPISFQIFCDEIQNSDRLSSVTVIDSSPKRLKQVTGTGMSLSTANISQAARIFRQYFSSLKNADYALIFGSNGYVLSMGPLLLLVAKLYRKPCFFRVFGGSLDQYCINLHPVLRWGVFQALRNFDGVIVQTALLHRYFADLLGEEKVHLVPGYRRLDEGDETPPVKTRQPGSNLRLAFLGIVKDEKGVFFLLESIKKLEAELGQVVDCHIYGPIHGPANDRFEAALAETEGASYEGVLKWDQVVSTLKTYDALVLPTFYQGEGHPGVLIEAMMAGIPVITTRFRSIPEIVQDRVNGLLAEPQNADSLAEAIKTLYQDDELLATMSKNSIEMSRRYDARDVIPMIIEALNIDRKS